MIIAHRGASSTAPENTIIALKKAIEDGATHLEIDVHQTKDNKIVAIHDYSIDRTTNGSGKIKDLTYSEIENYDAGAWFSNKFIGIKIPLLEEVLEHVPDSIGLIIEVKGNSDLYPNIEENIVRVLTKKKIKKKLILKSFNEETLYRFKQLLPDTERLLVYVFGFSVLDPNWQYLQHYELFLNKKFVETAQKKGFRVVAWGVQSKENMKRILSYGVNGIETDHPSLLKQVLIKESKAKRVVTDMKSETNIN